MRKAVLIILLILALSLITACEWMSQDQSPQNSTTDDLKPNEIVDVQVIGAQANFAFGEEFNHEDLLVTATMSNGKQKVLLADSYSLLLLLRL